MSAERLREAAGAIRDEWGGRGDAGTAWLRVVAFHLAVADWLDETASRFDTPGHRDWHGPEKAALAVADAFLGGTP